MSSSGLAFAGVLFDMDGTLIDTEPLWQAAEAEMMSEFSVEWTTEDQKVCHGGSALRVTNYMADRVEQSGQARPDPDHFAVGFERFMLSKLTNDPVVVQQGAMELLAEVKQVGLPTALVSSSQRVLMDAVLVWLGRDWFDDTISADDVQRHKPDPQPYLNGADAIGVDPAWCVAIEDSPTGVASAAAAGAFVVAVAHGADFQEGPRIVVVKSLLEVTVASLNKWFVPPTE